MDSLVKKPRQAAVNLPKAAKAGKKEEAKNLPPWQEAKWLGPDVDP